MRSHHSSAGRPRQGVILLVVVLMLTLFLVVGLSFVLYSQSQADSSRIYREAQTPDIADVAPETLLSWGLGQLIYPVPDDGGSVLSAMRGHELARTMYGWNYNPTYSPQQGQTYTATNPLQVDPTKTNVFSDPNYGSMANTTAFNGIGPLRGLALPPGISGVNEYDMVNYTWFSSDGFVRDPERPPSQTSALRTDPNQKLPLYAGGFNAPYTYPDRVNMALAAVQANPPDPVTNQPTYQPRLIAQSFVRPTATLPYSASNANTLQLDPTTSGGQTFWNTNSNAAWKYMTLRPRPADQLSAGETMYQDPTTGAWLAKSSTGSIRPAFPPPLDAGGDVKQLPGVPFVFKDTSGNLHQAQNDSSWMDLNYPVQISRNGRKFKPLFAFLILDLDGKINLNVHGNINAGPTYNQHASNQGLGRYEVNISNVLIAKTAANVAEWPLLFKGNSTGVYGRYGIDTVAGPAGLSYADPYVPTPTIGQPLRSLIFPLDFDAVDPANNRAITTKFNLPLSPNSAGQSSFASFPQFSTTGYDNFTFTATQTALSPLLNHPSLNQKLVPFGDDAVFGDENMYYLLANDYRKSVLYGVIPYNLGYDGSNATLTLRGNSTRLLVSTRSYDVDAPGAPPWVTNSANSNFTLAAATGIVNSTAGNYPTGTPMPTPAPGTGANQMDGLAVQAGKTNDYSDFKANDGRANLLSRVDLNRKLTSYNDQNGLFNGGQPVPPPPANFAQLVTQFPLTTSPQYRYYHATYDRQQFAMDIFNRLVQAAGAMTPDTAAVTSGATTLIPYKVGSLHSPAAKTPNYNATRWLAQLAVNIVDFIDDDEVITPFQWNPAPDSAIANGDSGWVYGVEAPKLVINEGYCELANDPTDTTAAVSGAKLPFQYNFWIELYNPMSAPNLNPAVATQALSTQNPPTNFPDRQDLNKISQFIKMPQDRMAVQLQRQSQTLGNYPIYQVQIVDESANPPMSLASPSNTDGSIVNSTALKVQVTGFMPDQNAAAQAPANSPTPYPDHTFVQPNRGLFNSTIPPVPPNNTGFYVMGPDSKHPFNQQQQQGGITLQPTISLQDQGQTPQLSTATPWGQPTGGTAKNSLTYQYQGPIPNTSPHAMTTRTHTVVLRRLACPNLDPNPIDPQKKTLPYPSNLVVQTKPYNPYVTVDFMTGLPTYDAVQYNSNPIPPTNKNANYVQPNQRHSIGKVQPYNSQGPKQQTASAPNPVNNTFFSHNSQTPPPAPMTASASSGQPGQGGPTLDWPFDWLTFADRQLTNVTEILNVPSTPPHLLTHAFAQYNTTTKQRDLTTHLAPWTMQDARIYRALEFFTVGDRSPYPGTGGRLAGKININTVFDQPISDAMIDAGHPSNFFTVQATTDVWQGKLKNPANLNDPQNLSDPTNNSFRNRKRQLLGLQSANLPLDNPFMSMAAPVVAAASNDSQYPAATFPNGIGIQNTILPYQYTAQGATTPSTGGTFMPQTSATPSSISYTPATTNGQAQQIPPWVMNELLTKIAGHQTVRSNNFAVFLTVGFFEVVDDTTLPVKLGAEITTASGKAIRHQMFSIVDRTNLALAIDPANPDPMARLRQAPIPPVFMSVQDTVPPGTAQQSLTIAGGIPTDYDGTSPVVFSPGQTLFLDTGRNQEWVTVQAVSVSSGIISVVWPQGQPSVGHPGGAMLSTYPPGNPGPQGPIDYASPQYRAVVPYTYIIQ